MLLASRAGLAFTRSSDGKSSWSFSRWQRVDSVVFGGHDIIAAECIAEDQVIMEEVPLLVAASSDHSVPGWGAHILQAFCSAPSQTQAGVLAFSTTGEQEKSHPGAGQFFEFVCSDIAREVARCADQPWRRRAATIADSTLSTVLCIFHLNGYAYGRGHSALYEFGCMLNHSCESNVRYSSSGRRGRGTFVSSRAIATGESLCTNYLGGYANMMSTPARRDPLLA